MAGESEVNMSNMSYCRFENTEKDLRDCFESLANTPPDQLSEREGMAYDEIVAIMKEWLCEYEGCDI
jgi:hypothetical protein